MSGLGESEVRGEGSQTTAGEYHDRTKRLIGGGDYKEETIVDEEVGDDFG